MRSVTSTESGAPAKAMLRFHRRWTTRLWVWLMAAAVVLLLFYGLVGYWGCADMFGDHPRWRGMDRGPVDFGLRAETVSFNSQDGIALRAWWLPAVDTPRGTVIIAHGIDHTRQVMLPRAAFLVGGGWNVLTPDLRGHGESGGLMVSPGLLEMRDILGGVRYIRLRQENGPIAVLGLSYGAAAALLASAGCPEIAAVVSDGAFTSGKDVMEDIGRHYVHDTKAKLWLRTLFLAVSCPGVARSIELTYYLRSGIDLGPDLLSVIQYAARIRIPVLLISGERDWIVPTERARQILSAILSHQKELVIIPNAVHDTTFSTAPTLYANAVLKFLNTYVQK